MSVESEPGPLPGDLLFTLGMEINAADRAPRLVETDVIEPLETRPGYRAHAVVGDEEIFLPPHEDVFPLGKVLVAEIGPSRLPRERAPGWEAVPVLHVDLLVGAPFGVAGLKCVFVSDDFAFDEGGLGWVVGGEA